MYTENETRIAVGGQLLPWRNESRQKPPQRAVVLASAHAAGLLETARSGCAVEWTGDFHQAKQLLAAVKKRLAAGKPSAAPADAAAAFHRHRLRQAQNSRLVNMLAVRIQPGFVLSLPRAPDVSAALADVYGEPNTEPFLLPLQQLLGFIGAHEWHKKGVAVAELDGRIHVPFGVYSPLRGEYIGLLAAETLPPHVQTAFDIGTGSGVLAALLAKRGIPRIVATDNNPRAVACARANLSRLGWAAACEVRQTDRLPEGQAGLIVCNPPWLPAKPTSAVETALYDPDHAMLRSVLAGAAAHLLPGGELWLVLSDLAEHLGLRDAAFLPDLFAQYGWQTVAVRHTRPQHGKAADAADPLAFARSRERTTLYRLRPLSDGLEAV